MSGPKNTLLGRLTAEDRAAFVPQLELVDLGHKQHLLESHA
jgi:hypothetical protein